MNTVVGSPSSAGEWRLGWGVVLAAAMGIGIGGMHVHFIGAMIKPLQAAYGWSRGDIAFGMTLISGFTPVANILAGMIADRIGARKVVLVGTLLFGLGFCLLGMAGPELWSWYVACGCFALFALAVSPVLWTMMVVKRFVYQRGLALALCLSGSGVMLSITPILAVSLVPILGVRNIFFVVGLCGSSLLFFVALIFFRDTPKQIIDKAINSIDIDLLQPDLKSISSIVFSRCFWQLAISLLLIACCIGAFIIHFQSLLTDSGLSPTAAASVAFFMGPAMIVGRLTTGFFFDRADLRLVAGVAFILPAIACLLLLFLNGEYLFSSIVGIVIGLGMGAEVDVIAYFTSRYFGLRHYGVIFGALVGLYVLGLGVGSAVAGVFYDHYQSYDIILMVLGCGALLATLFTMLLGRPPE